MGRKLKYGASSRILQEIISVFSDQGFDVQTLIEPTFDLPERTIFESAGKLTDYEELVGVSPIYILKLRRRLSNHFSSLFTTVNSLQLTGARIALGSDAWLEEVSPN